MMVVDGGQTSADGSANPAATRQLSDGAAMDVDPLPCACCSGADGSGGHEGHQLHLSGDGDGDDRSSSTGTAATPADNAADADPSCFSVKVAHGADKAVVGSLRPHTTVRELRQRLADRFGVPVESQTNLIFKGRNLTKAGVGDTLAGVGLDAAFKGRLVLVGVTAAEAERFRTEEQAAVRRESAQQRARERSDAAGGAGGGTGGPRVVDVATADAGRFLTLAPLSASELPAGAPGPSEAMALLERLRSDRGVAAIMAKYGWTVGKLSEFAPSMSTGIVGVTSGCLLGYNKNRGEEISLRLRTDDFRGFRYYGTVLKTLIHELTHMRHSEHDRHFWEFNSVLTREYHSLDWQRSDGRAVGGSAPQVEAWEAATPAEMAAYAAAERVLAQRKAAEAAAATEAAAAPETASKESGDADAGASKSLSGRGAADGAAAGGAGTAAADPAPVDAAPAPAANKTTAEPQPPAVDSAAAAAEAARRRAGSPARRVKAYREALGAVLATADDATRPLADSLVGLTAACGDDADALARSVGVMRKLVSNLRTHPGEAKFRTVRLGNAKVHESVGRYPPAVAFLERAGFARAADAGAGAVLTYGRDDPGLLWLASGLLDAAAGALEGSGNDDAA